MDTRIRIMVADDQADTRKLVKRYMSFTEDMEIVAEADCGEEVIRQLEDTEVDVILMDINMPGMNGLEATEIVAERYPDVCVIIMSVQGEVEYFKRAMVSGAREYIVKPFELDVLTGTIRSTYEKELKRRENRPAPLVEEVVEGKVLSFFGSKGGVGKSVLAVNTAILLSKMGKKTILVDLDLQFGDVGMLTDLKPRRSIAELVMEYGEPSAGQVLEYVEAYDDHLSVLLAPKKPELAEVVKAGHVQIILEHLKTQYEVVIVDLGTNYDEHTLSAMDAAQTIFFVTTLDMLSIKNAKLGLDVMTSLNYGKDKIRLVLNRWKTKTKIKPADIERVLGFTIDHKIAEESKYLLETINRGEPFVKNKRMKSTRFYKSMNTLAGSLFQGV